MRKNFKRLIKLANKLDSLGCYAEATVLDKIIAEAIGIENIEESLINQRITQLPGRLVSDTVPGKAYTGIIDIPPHDINIVWDVSRIREIEPWLSEEEQPEDKDMIQVWVEAAVGPYSFYNVIHKYDTFNEAIDSAEKILKEDVQNAISELLVGKQEAEDEPQGSSAGVGVNYQA